MACKPGSVLSPKPKFGPAMAIHLGVSLPTRSSNLPGQQRKNTPYAIPIWSCSGWGLPCRHCHQQRGALLPHPFTLACTAKAAIGGLLSVALSLRLPSAGVTRHPVPVEPGLSSPAFIHVWMRRRPPGHLVTPHVGPRPREIKAKQLLTINPKPV